MQLLLRLWDRVKSQAFMAIIALVGLGLAIYQGFYYEKRPEVQVRINAVSRVFDVLQPVGGLQVFYRGEDLRNKKEQLSIVSLSIINSGNTVIRKDDFDETFPFGLEIHDGVIAEKPTLSSASPYLQSALTMASDSKNIHFNKVIFEPGDSFQLSVLLLSSEGATPSITPAGKIAGVKQIDIVTPTSKGAEKSWWQKAVGADEYWVHFARAILYFFFLIFVWAVMAGTVIILVLPFILISNYLEQRKREKKLDAYKPNESLDAETRFLCERYKAMGNSSLEEAWRAVRWVKQRRELIVKLSCIKDEPTLVEIANKLAPTPRSVMFSEAIEKGVVRCDQTNADMSATFERNVVELAEYLGIDLELKQKESDHPA